MDKLCGPGGLHGEIHFQIGRSNQKLKKMVIEKQMADHQGELQKKQGMK